MLAVDILFDAARGVLGALLMAELALAHAQALGAYFNQLIMPCFGH